MARNYYLILGVDPDASLDEIRSAYRRKAKQLHPDRYEGSSEPFRDVQEAYEALCDPARRKAYDAERARENRVRAVPRRVREEPLRPRRCPVEPLIPDVPYAGFERTPLDPFPGALPFERLWEQVSGWAWPASRAPEHDRVTIPLTRAQAQRGGRARVWIATQAPCPVCRGDGRVGFFECEACYGEGVLEEQRPVWIAFPAGVADRSVARVSLAPLGLPDAYLEVRFRVHG